MIPLDLEEKWNTLERMERRDVYEIIRVSADCHPEVSVGVSPSSERCLILTLPKYHRYEFRPIEREKLSLSLVGDRDIVVTLLDREFTNLFDDLIVSMHNEVRSLVEADEYTSRFVKIFHKWSQFFDASNDGLLPTEALRGLFGELVVLRYLIIKSAGSEINDLLKAWRGPYDQGPDFVLNAKDIEVKTRVADNASVKVASEDQLEQRQGKGLELAVVTLISDGVFGATIEGIVKEVIDLVKNRLGDASIVYAALLQKGLSPQSLAAYADEKFKAVRIAFFDCLANDFPRIVRSALPKALSSVRYCINTGELANFNVLQVDL